MPVLQENVSLPEEMRQRLDAEMARLCYLGWTCNLVQAGPQEAAWYQFTIQRDNQKQWLLGKKGTLEASCAACLAKLDRLKLSESMRVSRENPNT